MVVKEICGLDTNSNPLAYKQGDMVRLVRNERGALAMGKNGDWGRIERVRQTGLTIKIAGYSQAQNSDIARLNDIPIRFVEPCTERGLLYPPNRHKFRITSSVRNIIAREEKWSSWILAIIYCSAALVLTVGAAILSKSMGAF